MTEAYPLKWPAGWPRTERRQRSRFDTSIVSARGTVLNELRLMRARQVVINSNIPTRQDGLPYALFREPDDPGIAVYFLLDGRELCIPCDKWNLARDNLHAIGKTIGALRGLERWGAKSMVDAAFRGFTSLPSPDDMLNWRQLFGINGDHFDEDEIRTAYRRARKAAHPDHGGNDDQFNRVEKAWALAQAELRI